MKKMTFLLCLAFLLLPSVFGMDVREFIVDAVNYTVDSKIKCKAINVTPYNFIDSMVLYKDGRKHHFSFMNRPNDWGHYIYNDDSGPGQFEWESVTRDADPVGNTVIFTKHYQVYELLLPIEQLITPERLKEGSFSLGEEKYRNIPCYKIIIRYPASDQAISHTSFYNFDRSYTYFLKQRNHDAIGVNYRVTPDFFEHNRDELSNEYFAAVQLWVDKTPGRPFIYAMSAINRNGKCVYAMNWGEVEFLDHIDPVEFQLPGKKIIPVDNDKEHAKQSIALMIKMNAINAPPGWISRQMSAAGSWFEVNLGTILSWGGKITFCIAVITTLLVIILKIKAYRKR